jgi:catechol 2,3-dioxygenase-like lactoylglutathione lyase family enzyme
MIEGISHITLIVSDLEKSKRIIVDVLCGEEIYDSSAKNFSISKEKFFDVNGLWLVLMEGPALPEKTYNHIAFKIQEADLPKAEKAIKTLGLEVKPPRPRIEGEGQSLYFYDYDNHMFELHIRSNP